MKSARDIKASPTSKALPCRKFSPGMPWIGKRRALSVVDQEQVQCLSAMSALVLLQMQLAMDAKGKAYIDPDEV